MTASEFFEYKFGNKVQDRESWVVSFAEQYHQHRLNEREKQTENISRASYNPPKKHEFPPDKMVK